MTVDRFVQLGFWLLIFPFLLLAACIALGQHGLVSFLFPYLTCLGLAFRLTEQLTGRFVTLDASAAFILSVVLLQSLTYGLVIILNGKKTRTFVLLGSVHLGVYLTSLLISWWYIRGH